MNRLGHVLDPTRSLATAVGWLAAMLSLVTAALIVWVGNIVDDHLLAARDAALSTAAKALAAEMDRALSLQLQALESLRTVVPASVEGGDAAADPALSNSLDKLRAAHPELEWIGLADKGGRLVAQAGSAGTPNSADSAPWFQRCLQGAWFGDLKHDRAGQFAGPKNDEDGAGRVLGLCTPIVDGQGRTAVVAAHLPQRWLAAIAGQVGERVNVDRRARALVVDDHQQVLVDNRASPANALPRAASAESQAGSVNPFSVPGQVLLERLDDGKRQVVVRARADESATLRRLGLQVIWVQPSEEAFWRGGIVHRQVAWTSLGLSLVAGLIGIVFARRLTRRLTDLTAAVRRVGTTPGERIDPPAGRDEVSELGHAFTALLNKLRDEHEALNTLTLELEHRVLARTREVERLAADSRYAAVVRERLRLARDLHDTLAHSMMAMLAEVRMLRQLHTHDPSALPAELERAEQVAHDGLNEARHAISQMRLNAVRDLGLGPALGAAISRFAESTGLDIAYTSDAQAASFADGRAEVVFRIAEEALRNIVRHAGASHVDVALRDGEDATIELTIRDDGVGFDPDTPHPEHYGLIGMREQAQLIDAELSLTSEANRGSTLRLWLRIGPDLQS